MFETLRKVIVEAAPGAVEVISYGMPFSRLGGGSPSLPNAGCGALSGLMVRCTSGVRCTSRRGRGALWECDTLSEYKVQRTF